MFLWRHYKRQASFFTFFLLCLQKKKKELNQNVKTCFLQLYFFFLSVMTSYLSIGFFMLVWFLDDFFFIQFCFETLRWLHVLQNKVKLSNYGDLRSLLCKLNGFINFKYCIEINFVRFEDIICDKRFIFNKIDFKHFNQSSWYLII